MMSTLLLATDPRAIGRYRILGRLGAGGMATVYLAETGGDAGGTVALKLIHEHLAADAGFVARFEREIQLAARVPAHCTAALLDTGVHHERPYLVTEYLAGTALHRLVQTEGPLDPASTHNIAVGLAAGLTAIHDCDLVHRDVKPSNVMITRGGVRIIDFGIARTLDTSTDLTGSGFMMGSLGWTSPEQLEGRPPMPAMDVFAWGCVLAYAATGRHPFGGDDAVARSWRILNAEPDLTGVPDTVADLVGAALERNTANRPTAQELLLGLVGGSGPVVKVRAAVPAAVEAEPPGRAPRRSRWMPLIGAVSLGLAGAVALLPASGNGVMLDRPVRSSPSATVQPPPVEGDPTRTPGGNSRPGTGGGRGATEQPGAGPSTATTTTTTENPGNDGNGNGPGNNGNGNGNGNKPSKKPKG